MSATLSVELLVCQLLGQASVAGSLGHLSQLDGVSVLMLVVLLVHL